MRGVRGVAAAWFLAVVFTDSRDALAGPDWVAGNEPRYLLFATTDLWRHGGFLHSGVVWSPGGLDHDGFALKVMFGGGLYNYVSGALGNIEVTGRQLSAAILPGWRFGRGALTLTVFAGLDLQSHRLSPDDPTVATYRRRLSSVVLS